MASNLRISLSWYRVRVPRACRPSPNIHFSGLYTSCRAHTRTHATHTRTTHARACAHTKGEALIWTLGDGLGEKFTEEVCVYLLSPSLSLSLSHSVPSLPVSLSLSLARFLSRSLSPHARHAYARTHTHTHTRTHTTHTTTSTIHTHTHTHTHTVRM